MEENGAEDVLKVPTKDGGKVEHDIRKDDNLEVRHFQILSRY